MPFNPSDPRGSIAGLLANGNPSITARGPGSAIDPMTPWGGAGPSPGAVAANPFANPGRVAALNSMGGDLPMPSGPPMASRSGVPGAPGPLPPTVGIDAGPSGSNPLLGARGEELAAFAAGVPGNPLYAGTGGNSPGVTVTPGITPSNYGTYFPGQSPTSAADPASISNYPQYTSVAGPGGNTSWMGNAAAGSLPFDPAMTPSTPDIGLPPPGAVDPWVGPKPGGLV